MLNIILNIIGITLVLYSIYIIKRDMSKKKVIEAKKPTKPYDEPMDDLVKEYYESIGQVSEDFDFIMDDKIQALNYEDIDSQEESEEKIMDINPIIKDERTIAKDEHINPLHKKIMELEYIGLSNEEIAKKLGRSIREIDIVLKVHKK